MIQPRTLASAIPLVLVLVCLICANTAMGGSEPSISSFASSVDTKGTPFKGEITARDGGPIANMQFFGEGTDKIYFDRNQALILKDDNGRVIAGFEITAVDPNRERPTAAYELKYEEGGKPKRLLLEHPVAKTVFRNGRLSVEKADEKVLTSYWVGKTQLTVLFQGVKNHRNQKGETVNTIVFSSPGGQEFEFEITPSTRMWHMLSKFKGDIILYLKKTEQQMKK